MMYSLLLKPFFFLFPPEKAHHLTMKLFRAACTIPFVRQFVRSLWVHEMKQPIEAFGLKFKNAVGMAAGFDKDGKYLQELSDMGFGCVEVGTVTPRPQAGNPSPRLFRLKQDHALINRMGFNNEGVDALVQRLKNRPSDIIVGGNIGKNKDTPNEQATEDYQYCFEQLFDYVDYFVVNVSSPNTPGLRALQEKGPLTALLQTLQDQNQRQSTPKPILLKIAPDLTDSQLDDIDEIVKQTRIAGIIATNTTIERTGLKTTNAQLDEIGNGGLSGQPILKRSTAVLHYLHQKSNSQYQIIGVGGIESAANAQEKKMHGAALVQIYTGLIYKGPGLVNAISKAW